MKNILPNKAMCFIIHPLPTKMVGNKEKNMRMEGIYENICR